jgi:hypothetical protein
MKHISQIGIIKEIPKLNKYQAKQVWQISSHFLPPDCQWKNGRDIALEALKIISDFYTKMETTSMEKICARCCQLHPGIFCRRRIN